MKLRPEGDRGDTTILHPKSGDRYVIDKDSSGKLRVRKEKGGGGPAARDRS